MNTVPQVRHSWTAARHSITRRLIPAGVSTRSKDLLYRVLYPQPRFAFGHRVMSMPPHEGHVRATTCTRWLARSFRFRCWYAFRRAFRISLLVRA
jgi:hypothetical protein